MSPPELQRAREKNQTLEIKIISANDVSLINVVDKMDVYAVVSIASFNIQNKQAAKTPVDYDGGSNPTWNHTVKFSINEEASLLTLKVKLFSYWLEGENDLYVGEVNVSVQELLASNPCPLSNNGNNDQLKLVTLPVKIMERTKGMLSFSYRVKPEVPVDEFYPSAPDYSLSFGQPPINPNLHPVRGEPVMYSPQLQTKAPKLTLQLLIKSAKDICKVGIGNDLNVYASVMILYGKTKVKDKTNTPAVYCTYRNPRWDHEVEFSLDEKSVREGHLTLILELVGVRSILGEKDIGEVRVPIQELFDEFNPPSLPSTNGEDDNGMRLVTRGVSVTGLHKEKGTLSFTYRFLAEQASQSFARYPIHGTSGYAIVQPEVNPGPSNGQMPFYMQPQYHQSHGYQLQPQKSQSQLQPLHQPILLTNSQSQSQSQSHQYQQYSPPQPQLQPLSQQLTLTQPDSQTQGARPTSKPQGGSIAALGPGAAVMGRVIGGALTGDMMSDEVNIYAEA